MGDWFFTFGMDQAALLRAGGRPRLEPVKPGEYVCARCGSPLVPCVECGRPAMCGDAWCEHCQPDG